MAKSVTVIAVVISVVAVATAVAVVTPDRIDLRGAIAQPGDKISEKPSDKPLKRRPTSLRPTSAGSQLRRAASSHPRA